MNYRYIGTFTVISGEMVIMDPAIHPFMKCFDNGELPKMTREIIENMYSGHYVAYHAVGDDGTLVKLLIVHEGLSPDAVARMQPSDCGMAAIIASGTAAIVDKIAVYDGTKAKYLLYSDAYYDAASIIKKLPEMPYSDTIKDDLKGIAEQAIIDGVPVLGFDIFRCTDGANNPVWPGFCTLPSTHWSMDCCVRVHDDYRRGDTIFGGVVSTTDRAGLLGYYVYRDKKNKGYAVCLDLFNDVIDNYYASLSEQDGNSDNLYANLSSPAGILPANLSENGSIRKNLSPMGFDGFYGTEVRTDLDIHEAPILDSHPVLSGFLRDREREYAKNYSSVCEADSEYNADDRVIGRENFLQLKIEKNVASSEEIDEYFFALMQRDDEYFHVRMDDEYISTIMNKRNDYLGVVRSLNDVCLDDFFTSAKECYPEVRKYFASKRKNTEEIK